MRRLAVKSKNDLRSVRHTRVRSRIRGTAERPRLSVFRGLKAVTVQLVDDAAGRTLCFVKSSDLKKVKAGAKDPFSGKAAAAYAAGLALAEKAKALGITRAVFDRGGYHYHGRVAAVAAGARTGGLAL